MVLASWSHIECYRHVPGHFLKELFYHALYNCKKIASAIHNIIIKLLTLDSALMSTCLPVAMSKNQAH